MTELLERINLMLEINMITDEEYNDLNIIISILQDYMNFPITDARVGIFITHIVAAMKRQRDNEKVNQLDPAIFDEVKSCEEFRDAESIISKMIDAMQTTLVNDEVDFIYLHLCNILKAYKRGETMKIAIGGLKKNEMKAAVLAANPDIEVIVTNDMQAIPMLKNKEVDYYLGACESGGGAAISILIGAIGYAKCATICKNGENPKRDNIQKFVNEGKVVFGMAHDKIHLAAPILIEILSEKGIGGE